MAAGLAMLSVLESDVNFYQNLSESTEYLAAGIVNAAKAYNIPMTANTIGGMFGLFFSDEKQVSNFAQASNCNIERFKAFYQLMLSEGVYLAPSAYEAGFLSVAHGKNELDKTIEAASKAFSQL